MRVNCVLREVRGWIGSAPLSPLGEKPSEFVFALDRALGVGAVADLGGGFGELAAGGFDDLAGFREAVLGRHQCLRAVHFGEREHVLPVALDADALQLAQFGGFAGYGLERVEPLPLLRVGRCAQLLDGVVDAARLGLFTGGRAE